jgi:hypothetical protein
VFDADDAATLMRLAGRLSAL